MIHNSPPGYDTKGANVKHKKYEKGRRRQKKEERQTKTKIPYPLLD